MINQTGQAGQPIVLPTSKVESTPSALPREKEANPNCLVITEQDKEHEKWYQEAKQQTPETLQGWVNHLINDYEHDYGTIIHAMAAGALGTINVIDHSPQGGITGFQASGVMWNFVQHWLHQEGKPMRLVEFEKMLYPQYESSFKTISSSTADWLKIEARKKLLSGDGLNSDVRTHLERVAGGEIPFGYTISNED